MATANERPEPPVLDRNGLQLGQDRRFTVNGIDRMNGQKMAELFHPERLRSRRDQVRIITKAMQLFKKPWFAAQLTHYGIKFSAKASKARLWDLLERAVDAGKASDAIHVLSTGCRCNYVSEAVMRVQQSMCRDYEIMFRKWEDDACAWDAAKKRDDEALATAKRLEPLLAVRCHRPSIILPAPQVEVQALPAKKNLRQAVWVEAMEAHGRHVSQQVKGDSKKGKPAKTGTQQPFDLKRCQGSYILFCKAADGYREHDSKALFTLDISVGRDGTLMAAHDFGLFEGTMILSLTEERLKWLDELEGISDSDKDSHGDGCYGSDAEGCKIKGPSLVEVVASGKRKAKGTVGGGPSRKKSKKTKLTPSLSRRVYYRMRGRKTGEGTIHDTSEAGHLDFLSDLGTKFVGLAYEFPYIGRNVEFRGSKISDAPRKKPEPWGSFSSAAGEYARAARW